MSGPARPDPGARTLPAADTAAVRLRGVLDAPFLDRLTRGRAWIGLVAVGLIGIVFMQVSLLRLNAGIGRSIQQAQGLERENAQLRDTVSRLASGERIEQAATTRGLVMPPSGTFHYLTAGRPGDAARAARNMKPPLNGPIAEEIPSIAGKANVGAATTAATPTPAPAATAQPATTSPPTTAAPPATTAAPPVQPTPPAPAPTPQIPATTAPPAGGTAAQQPSPSTATPTTPAGQ